MQAERRFQNAKRESSRSFRSSPSREGEERSGQAQTRERPREKFSQLRRECLLVYGGAWGSCRWTCVEISPRPSPAQERDKRERDQLGRRRSVLTVLRR